MNLSINMQTWLKAFIASGSHGGTRRTIPVTVFRALLSRGLVLEDAKAASSVETLSSRKMVVATITAKGTIAAVDLLVQEHRERLASGQRSERIPAMLRKIGVEVAA